MKKIKYTEPKDYIPKEIREKYFGKAATKKTAKKTTAAKKPSKGKSK